MNSFFVIKVLDVLRRGRSPTSEELVALFAFPGAAQLLEVPFALLPVVDR